MARRVGKLGIVRLDGKDLNELRNQCYLRDNGMCVECGRFIVEHPDSIFQANAYHMAHTRNKRMWGDTLENVRSKCWWCHGVKEHANGGMDKIIPAKS